MIFGTWILKADSRKFIIGFKTTCPLTELVLTDLNTVFDRRTSPLERRQKPYHQKGNMTRRRFSVRELLFLPLVFLVLEIKVKGEVQLVARPKQKISRFGQSLEINCTALFSKDSGSNLELIWKKVGSSSGIISRKAANNTLRLEIQSVSKSDEGEYQCVVTRQDHVLNSTSIQVIVGDLPDKPSAADWRSVNWHVCFNWNPVSGTGGLPVTYKIRYRCIKKCDLDDDENLLSNGWHEACKNTLPTPGREMKCCLDHVTLFIDYEAVVVVENALGSVSSSAVGFSRGIETTLGPPQSLGAQATGYGSITIDWRPPPDSSYWTIKYIIFYHAQGDSTNKTIILHANGQNRYLLTGLRPYTNYTVYIAGIGPLNSGVGIPVGPVVVLTDEENPSDAPEITDWDSIINAENPNRRNVTLTWKLPPKAKWNGKIRTFVIQYREISNKRIDIFSNTPWGESITINSSSGNQGMISNLLASSSYEVEMQMCNSAGCGGIGNRVVIRGRKASNKEEQRKVFDDQILIVTTILTIAIVLLLPVTILFCIRMRRIKEAEGKLVAATKCYSLKRTSYDRMEGEMAA